MRQNLPISDKEKAEIKKMLKNGMSVAKIAETLNRGEATIYRFKKKVKEDLIKDIGKQNDLSLYKNKLEDNSSLGQDDDFIEIMPLKEQNKQLLAEIQHLKEVIANKDRKIKQLQERYNEVKEAYIEATVPLFLERKND